MKINSTMSPDNTHIIYTLEMAFNDMEETMIIEAMNKAKEILINKAVEDMVNKHLQTIIEKINMPSLLNAVYLGTAREISKQIKKG